MRIYWTTLFTLFTFFAFAQTPTGDIQKDTALANRYFEEAVTLINQQDTTNRAISLLKKADALYEAHPFDKKLIEIRGWQALDQIKKSLDVTELVESTLELAEKEMPNDMDNVALSPIYYAMYRIFLQRDGKQALQYALRASRCADKNTQLYFTISSEAIVMASNLRQFSLADSLIKEATNQIEKQKGGQLNSYWLYVYKGKSAFYEYQKNYEQFFSYTQKMLIENEKYHYLSGGDVFDTYGAMAKIHSNFGDFDKAFEAMDNAKAAASAIEGTPTFGTYYSMLAMVHSYKYDYINAAENTEKAIQLFLKDKKTFRNRLKIEYINLGICNRNLEKYDEAIKNLKESEQYGEEPFVQFQLGLIFSTQKKFEAGLTELQKALVQMCTQFKDTDIYQNPSMYEKYYSKEFAKAILSRKGQAWYEFGAKEKEVSKLKESIKVLQLVLMIDEEQQQASKGFEKARNLYNQGLYNTLLSILLAQQLIHELEPSDENFNACFHTAERLKAIQLVETLSPSPLPKKLYSEEQRLIETIQYTGQKLDLATHNAQEDSIRFYQNTLFEANQALEKYMEQLRKDYPKEANNFYNITYASLDAVQKELSDETLLIEYVNATPIDEKFIITISQSGKNIYTPDIGKVKANIEKLNKLTQSRFAFQKGIREQFIQTSHELYNALIKPIEAELAGKSKLMIVVEGQLFHLPFELLLASDELKPYHELDFLIKKYEINYHYSATAFLRLKEKQTVKNNSLLAFAPVFNKGDELTEATRSLDFMVDSVYRSIENFEFTALPSTKKEVNTISRLVKSNNGQTNILLNKNATKNNLSQQLEKQSYQFVHIATHGLVNFKNPKLSALACYSKNETMENLMYANEIQFKDINADLVILSSCESGIGQLVLGEGLIALNRSFIYSGTKNVLFSLWKVSDEHSSQLMIDFYKSYFENPSYTSALRQAKLKMLENPKSALPKYWSAFVLMGE